MSKAHGITKAMPVKKEGWVLRVPANKKGEQFISKMREYLNTDSYSIKQRYTGPRPHGHSHSTRREDATSIRLYINTKGTNGNRVAFTPETFDMFHKQASEHGKLSRAMNQIRALVS